MSPSNNEFLSVFIDGMSVLLVVFIVTKMVNILYVVFTYRKKAIETDWNNQFQVQRLVNSLIYDEKIEKAIKKGFLEALADDCETNGYDDLANKARRAAKEV